MRLGDLDALKDNMFHYAAPEMMWDRGDIEHKIDEQPTIDAIPVEWLRKNMREPILQQGIHNILYLWQKEQEAQDE